MDGARFDALARALARPTSRRGAVALLAALLPAADPVSAGRRRGCRPRCGNGFSCVGRECVCPSGVTCGGACCAAGQACEAGACVTPEPDPTCIAAGQPCKGLGRACCDGRACASGQGGKGDIACYVPAGGPCGTTADCVYGAACRSGRCADATARCTVCAAGCPHTTIEGAVADPGFPVVTVAAGVYVPDIVPSTYNGRRLVIRRSVTVEACGDGPVTIDAECESGVVEIVAGADGPPNVTLRNLALVNGFDAYGGGVLLQQGSALLDGVIVRDSSAPYAGGGVYAEASTALTIVGASEITGCDAIFGGGVSAGSAAVVDIGGATVIRENRASSGGGGVHKVGNARLTIRDRAAITGNTSWDRGGGIYSTVTDGAISVVCAGAPTVCDNTANCPQFNCQGEFDASCAVVCCSASDSARGEVGAADC